MTGKQKFKLKNSTGQGIIEYILLVAAVTVALLIFFGQNGPFSQSYNRVIQQQSDDMLKTSLKVFN